MAYIHLTRLFFDFETEAHPNASSLIPEPEAPANYKDEAKIQAYKEEKWQRALEQAALDPDYGRISAFGWRVGTQGPNHSMLVDKAEHTTEGDILRKFWSLVQDVRGYVVGYNIIGFDLPYALRRSFALGIPVPIFLDLRRYQIEPVTDLMGILYNWEKADTKGLKFVAMRYNILNMLPELNGSMYANMDEVTRIQYVENDVSMVVDLYNKMLGSYFPAEI